MNDMDEKDRISSFLRRIWRMISTALQEWFPDAPSGPERNYSSHTDLRQGKKFSGSTDKNASEQQLKHGENLPEEAFLPGFQSGSVPDPRGEKSVDDLYVLPPEEVFAEEEVEGGEPAGGLFPPAPEMLLTEHSVSAADPSDRDRRKKTVSRGSEPTPDQSMLSGSSTVIRSVSDEKIHDEKERTSDVLSAIQTPSLPDGISIMTAAEPETVPEDQHRDDTCVFPVSGVNESSSARIFISNIGEWGDIYDSRGEKEFFTDHSADRELVFSVPGSSKKGAEEPSSGEGSVLSISFPDPEEVLTVSSVPETKTILSISGSNERTDLSSAGSDRPEFSFLSEGSERTENNVYVPGAETVFSSVSEHGQRFESVVSGRDMETVEHDAADPGNSEEEFALSYGQRSFSVFSVSDEETTFPADKGNKRIRIPDSAIGTYSVSSVSASGTNYNPGETAGAVPDPVGDEDGDEDLPETEDLTLYEQALHFLARDARSAAGKELLGFSHFVKDSVSDTEEELSPDHVSAAGRHFPEPFLFSGQQLAGQIRAGGSVMTVTDHTSVFAPDALFSERSSETPGEELLSERMKESIQVLNKINTCCENLKQIINEGMNI